MTDRPKLTVEEITFHERAVRLRMPFRFGVKTATHGRQAIVRATVRLEDGKEGFGYSAEALGAKWFDKNLALSDEDNHHQLRKALELAADAYLSNEVATPFDPSGNTALVGATLMFEILCILAESVSRRRA